MSLDNTFEAVFFGGDPRTEEFMLWLVDDDAVNQEEVVQKLANPLYMLLRIHAFDQGFFYKKYPKMLETEERAGGSPDWHSYVAESAGEFLDAWEREVKMPVGGHVYILAGKEEGEGLFKIGQTTDISTRIPALRIQCPWPTELLHRVGCAVPLDAEAIFHREYASKRANGEWFRLTEEDLKEIRSVSYISAEGTKTYAAPSVSENGH